MLQALAPAAPAPEGVGLRLFELVGNACEPDLRSGDFLMVSPIDRFVYDATYLLDFGEGEAPYVVSRAADSRFSIRHPNPIYGRQEVGREDLMRAITGLVVADVRVRDRDRIGRTAQRLVA